ncbi:MAG: peptidase M24, structural domain-containing protein [Monoraphidium minutum]|nr:MAG: peptidase M24, structural domain-containing protein [Monoraphidium minutum]
MGPVLKTSKPSTGMDCSLHPSLARPLIQRGRVGSGGGGARRRVAAAAAHAAGAALADARGAAPAAAPAPGGLPRVVPLAEQCRELREKLRGEVLAGGLVWLSAGDLQPRNGDVFHAFRAASDFVYAAGVTEPGWGCLLDLDSGDFTLAAPRVPEDLAIWSGPQPSLDDAASEVGAQRAVYLEDVKALVASKAAAAAAAGGGGSVLVHTTEGMAAALAAAGIGGGGARVTTDFLPQALARSRARKTAAEIACLLEANRVSAAAHEAAWAACAPGGFEYELEGAFVGACVAGGLRQLGYPCIVGAGPNAGVLHYERNTARIGRDDLVLIDAGAEFRCYTADITRTFPAGGAFEARRRAVYELALAMQSAALAAVRPGAEWKADVEAPARRLMLEGLRDMGLVRGDVEAMLQARVDRVFCPHGLGHHLGLDVHDASEDGPVPATLDAGNVVTCEPGVYFMPLLQRRALADAGQAPFLNAAELDKWAAVGGVRIEDNVALLPAAAGGGVLNLTAAAGAAPKGAAEIEAVMAAARGGAAARR